MGLYVSPCVRTKLSHVKYISYHPDVPLLAVPQIIYELFSGFIESVEVISWCLNVVIKMGASIHLDSTIMGSSIHLDSTILN